MIEFLVILSTVMYILYSIVALIITLAAFLSGVAFADGNVYIIMISAIMILWGILTSVNIKTMIKNSEKH